MLPEAASMNIPRIYHGRDLFYCSNNCFVRFSDWVVILSSWTLAMSTPVTMLVLSVKELPYICTYIHMYVGYVSNVLLTKAVTWLDI